VGASRLRVKFCTEYETSYPTGIGGSLPGGRAACLRSWPLASNCWRYKSTELYLYCPIHLYKLLLNWILRQLYLCPSLLKAPLNKRDGYNKLPKHRFSFISGERIKVFLTWMTISAIEEWKNQAAHMYVSDRRGRSTRLLQFHHGKT